MSVSDDDVTVLMASNVTELKAALDWFCADTKRVMEIGVKPAATHFAGAVVCFMLSQRYAEGEGDA